MHATARAPQVRACRDRRDHKDGLTSVLAGMHSGDASVPVSHLVLAALVVLAGYLVFGVTGFGASPITIPVLVHVFPLTFVLPLAAVLDLGSAVALGLRTRRDADVRELATLVPFTLVGLTLGVTLLVRLPRNATLLALGLFVCAFALHVILRRDAVRRLGRGWAAPAGIAGGVIGALFGMGGPPYVMYIAGRIADPAAQRATISQMVVLNVGLRVGAFALAGLLCLTRAVDHGGAAAAGGLGRGLGGPSCARAPGARGGGAHHRRGAARRRGHADREGLTRPPDARCGITWPHWPLVTCC